LAGAVLAGAVLATDLAGAVATVFLAGAVVFLAGATVFLVTTAFLAEPAALAGGDFLAAAVFLTGAGRDAGTFFAGVALLAGVIMSSFPTIDVVGPLTTTAPRERVTIADGVGRGQ
jgi:hypothetical protein